MAQQYIHDFDGVLFNQVESEKCIKLTLVNQHKKQYNMVYFKSNNRAIEVIDTVFSMKRNKIRLFFEGSYLDASCNKMADGTYAANEISIRTPDIETDGLPRVVNWIQDFTRWISGQRGELVKVPIAAMRTIATTMAKLCQLHPNVAVIKIFEKYEMVDMYVTRVKTIAKFIEDVHEHMGLFHHLKHDVKMKDYEDKIGDHEILKAMQFCGDYKTFCENPYNVYKKSRSCRMQFATLDKFAEMYDVPLHERIQANLWHVMQTIMSNEGHVCYPIGPLVTRVAQNMGINPNEVEEIIRGNNTFAVCNTSGNKVTVATTDDNNENEAIGNDDMVFLGYVYGRVKYIVERVQDYINRGLDSPLVENIEEMIDEYSIEHNFIFGEDQRSFLIDTFSKDGGVFILTGYPGTGKSSIVNCIQYIAQELKLNIALCAPTGKAANRLGQNAATIHRLLEVKVDGTSFKFNKNEDDPLNARIIVVDESSMLDLDLTYNLLQACQRKKRHIIFMGDQNQLPSVNYGSVLTSWINSGVIPHTHLTKIYRQAEGSDISKMAKDIVNGKMPNMESITRNKSVQLFQISDAKQIHRKVLELYLKHKGNLQVLIPTKKGETGTVAINLTIHKRLFPTDESSSEKSIKLQPDEKIICIKNTYAKDGEGNVISDMSVFNGDGGYFVKYTLGQMVNVKIDNKAEMIIPRDAVDVGYCMSVHKSQGSEYDTVIIVLNQSHGIMLNRQVLYTGITRAKKQLYIIGTLCNISQSVHTQNIKRYDLMDVMIASGFEVDSE